MAGAVCRFSGRNAAGEVGAAPRQRSPQSTRAAFGGRGADVGWGPPANRGGEGWLVSLDGRPNRGRLGGIRRGAGRAGDCANQSGALLRRAGRGLARGTRRGRLAVFRAGLSRYLRQLQRVFSGAGIRRGHGHRQPDHGGRRGGSLVLGHGAGGTGLLFPHLFARGRGRRFLHVDGPAGHFAKRAVAMDDQRGADGSPPGREAGDGHGVSGQRLQRHAGAGQPHPAHRRGPGPGRPAMGRQPAAGPIRHRHQSRRGPGSRHDRSPARSRRDDDDGAAGCPGSPLCAAPAGAERPIAFPSRGRRRHVDRPRFFPGGHPGVRRDRFLAADRGGNDGGAGERGRLARVLVGESGRPGALSGGGDRLGARAHRRRSRRALDGQADGRRPSGRRAASAGWGCRGLGRVSHPARARFAAGAAGGIVRRFRAWAPRPAGHSPFSGLRRNQLDGTADLRLSRRGRALGLPRPVRASGKPSQPRAAHSRPDLPVHAFRGQHHGHARRR